MHPNFVGFMKRKTYSFPGNKRRWKILIVSVTELNYIIMGRSRDDYVICDFSLDQDPYKQFPVDKFTDEAGSTRMFRDTVQKYVAKKD